MDAHLFVWSIRKISRVRRTRHFGHYHWRTHIIQCERWDQRKNRTQTTHQLRYCDRRPYQIRTQAPENNSSSDDRNFEANLNNPCHVINWCSTLASMVEVVVRHIQSVIRYANRCARCDGKYFSTTSSPRPGKQRWVEIMRKIYNQPKYIHENFAAANISFASLDRRTHEFQCGEDTFLWSRNICVQKYAAG